MECLVRAELQKEGFRVKQLKVKDRPYLNDYIAVEFRLKKTRGKKRRERNSNEGYESDSSGCDCCC